MDTVAEEWGKGGLGIQCYATQCPRMECRLCGLAVEASAAWKEADREAWMMAHPGKGEPRLEESSHCTSIRTDHTGFDMDWMSHMLLHWSVTGLGMSRNKGMVPKWCPAV